MMRLARFGSLIARRFSNASRGRRGGRSPSPKILIAAGALLALLVTLSATLFIRELHDRSVADSYRSLTGLSTVLADQADRALQAVELVQQSVADEIRSDAGSEFEFVVGNSGYTRHEALRARVAALPQIASLALVDTRGRLVNFSRLFPIPDVNVADRDYFQAFADDPKLLSFMGRPVRNRTNGAWTIYIARRITAENGSFIGLVLVGVDLQYFERLYGQIAPEPDYVISMFRDDGMLVTRHPARPESVGRHFKTAGAALMAAKGTFDGVVRNTSPIDGQDRLIATRSVAHYPLILSVSRTAAAGLAQWGQQAWALGAAAASLNVGLIALIWLGIRQLRSQETISRAEAARSAAEERERWERDLRNQYSRFGTALDNMTQGLCMFDGEDRLIVMNERYAELYGLSADIRKPGTPLADVLGHMAAGAICSSAGGRAFVAHCGRVAALGESGAFTSDLADGRAVSVVFGLIPEGGWVWTHEEVTERRKAEALVAHMAHHDALTGLPNRILLREHMDRVLADLDAGAVAAVLYLDLDGFKIVNDTLGHLAGDELLRQVAERLGIAAGPAEFVSRLGGDEFAIVQSVADQPAEAAALAARIVDVLRAPFELQGQMAIVGASIGIVLASCDRAMSADEMLRNADIALYRAKADGRNTWRFFEPAMDLELQERRVIEADLRKALAREEFELHYQALVDARTGQLTGFEALLRWRHPERGYVGPAHFIPLAEEIGMIRPIGAWVLSQACADATLWPEHVKVAVNLSPVQFLDGTLVGEVESALATSGLPPRRLELEITESVLLQHNELTVGLLHRLKQLGASISMDDFGTGYSSLSYLHRFPFDKIKIDQAFVRDLEREKERIAIVRAVVGLGKALGMTVLAEGVETRQQLEILQAEGCDELQGYLFSKPRPLHELGDLLAGRFHGTMSPAGPLLVISNLSDGQVAA